MPEKLPPESDHSHADLPAGDVVGGVLSAETIREVIAASRAVSGDGITDAPAETLHVDDTGISPRLIAEALGSPGDHMAEGDLDPAHVAFASHDAGLPTSILDQLIHSVNLFDVGEFDVSHVLDSGSSE